MKTLSFLYCIEIRHQLDYVTKLLQISILIDLIFEL